MPEASLLELAMSLMGAATSTRDGHAACVLHSAAREVYDIAVRRGEERVVRIAERFLQVRDIRVWRPPEDNGDVSTG